MKGSEERRAQMRLGKGKESGANKIGRRQSRSFMDQPSGPPPADLTGMTDYGVVDHLASSSIYFSKEPRYTQAVSHVRRGEPSFFIFGGSFKEQHTSVDY